MSENRRGQIITFYSYKGGTGRTMALANVAWILAANGKRVLVSDWDLEAPGLHRFFRPFIDLRLLDSAGGVIDLVRKYEWATTKNVEQPEGWHTEYAKVKRHAFSLNWRFPDGGTIDFLGAGHQNLDYATGLSGMDWDTFHEQLGGGQLLDALRANMKHEYDYTLIDSRTGFSDVAEVCTVHLPDVLVDCFTYSEQGILGGAQAAKSVRDKYGARKIRILPVPMRVDDAEKQKAEVSKAVAMQRFAGFPSDMTDEERAAYWAAVAVPYQSFYSYEETLATFSDQPGSPRTLLYAYEMLTRHITNGEVTSLPPMDKTVRTRTVARFTRHLTAADEQIVLRYAPEDQVWAEWISELLRTAGVRVRDPYHEVPAGADADLTPSRYLRIVSATSASVRETPPERAVTDSPLVVYVTDAVMLPGFAAAASAYVSGLSAEAAAERILKLIGVSDVEVDVNQRSYSARFPGQEPDIFGAPARNARFTGREDELLNLRAQLRTGGNATVAVLPGTLPVALQGMGGIGKTQLAIEYAHRFRAAYDVVWWISADPANFIDTLIADLGVRLKIPSQPTVLETARATIQMLERGDPHRRWLLIFDNAEELDKVGDFLPKGRGHVLITSRDQAWGDRARPIQLDVFQRAESTAHLTRRVPTIRPDEANRIAEMLGDLPIAVNAAGAWLADTGTEVSSYIQQLEQHGPNDDSVDQTFVLALQRLKQRSEAAYRLLQLCSVLAPEIDLELVYSDEMALALTKFDSSVSERIVRGSLVQQINRLALLRLDGQRSQIQVHRVLQHVVRSRMTQDELDEARHEVHVVLAASRPSSDVDDPRSWPRFRMLWPHLEASDAVSCTDEGVRQLLIDRLRYLAQRGDLPGGRRLAERMNTVWGGFLKAGLDGKRRDDVRRQLLHMRFNLANIIRDEAKFEESRALNEEVLTDQTALLGSNHPHTLMTAGGLAADLRALGRYAEALKLDQQTHATWAEFYGEDHPRTLMALNNLAAAHRHMGQFRPALAGDQFALARRRVVLGENHPHTLGSASNLGRDIREAGEYDRSVAQLRSVSETLLQQWGPDFRITLNAQANLATSLRSAGQAAEAATLLENAYERLNETLGPLGPDTLACRLSRAVNLLALNRIELATGELEEVRRAYEESLGADHPHTLLCVSNLAAAARAGTPPDAQLARQLARTASDHLARVLSDDHPYTLAARVNLAVCTAEEGDVEAAYQPIQEAATQLAKVLGPDHPDTVRCDANLAMLGGKLGINGSDAMADKALERLVMRLGRSHPAVEALVEGKLLHRIVEPHPF
ncbi:hypothetical protein Rhe02_41090 [Rhizocola hellebori]|uniref:Tetratricopeptide repeat protein n=1 Tax=Rhizocola hellebori TaxID=1392758 RepID=A0A8J3VHA3_9ACTN|nr:FxSxx-COOH system tetratricopeptide repeat protein [Rhizocola hellebori]GIH06042.1 hypothetical protein Rhe02_41090 [Rhizocola hellebori]